MTLEAVIIFIKAWWHIAVTTIVIGAISYGAYSVYHHIDKHSRAAQLAIDAPLLAAANAKIASMVAVSKVTISGERAAATAAAVSLNNDAKSNWNTFNATSKTSDAEFSALLASVSNHKTRIPVSRSSAIATPGDTGAPTAVYCTGGMLYQNDGQFLAEYAHDADVQSRSLQYCKSQYDAVKSQMDDYRKVINELIGAKSAS
jgi:hypothetical protein